MAAGQHIKRLRGKVSANTVANFIGVDPVRLRKWEQRDSDPKDSGDIKKVEDYFGVSINELGKLDKFQFIPKGEEVGQVNEPESKYGDPTIRDVLNVAQKNQVLFEANKTLADANKKLAEAHYLLAQGNHELILVIKDLVKSGISSPEVLQDLVPPDPARHKETSGFRRAASGKTQKPG